MNGYLYRIGNCMNIPYEESWDYNVNYFTNKTKAKIYFNSLLSDDEEVMAFLEVIKMKNGKDVKQDSLWRYKKEDELKGGRNDESIK